MGNLEAALKDLNRQDGNEITLAAIQDVNDILNTLISTWDQWAGGCEQGNGYFGPVQKVNEATV